MSRLPNAPLVEVLIELRWKIKSKEDLTKVQFLYGDIYAELKNKYPHRETIIPVEIPIELTINQPAYRFRVEKDKYPLYQVGPGVFTVNTIHEIYDWETFYAQCDELIEKFLGVYSFKKDELINPTIQYLDFFPINFNQENVIDFVNKRFKVKLEQSFIQNPGLPTDINLAFSFNSKPGNLLVFFQKGRNSKGQEGILLQTKVTGNGILGEKDLILEWLDNAHNMCSESFKKLTAGELYESFK